MSAEKAGISPEDYVKGWHKKHTKDFKDIGISFDFYYYTHSPEQRQFAQQFFLRLKEKGYIFQQEVKQYYCEKDRKFLPDRYVKGTCPFCGAEQQYGDGCEKCGRTYAPTDLKDPVCAICGNIPVIKKSLHYFFKLSQFSDSLKRWLESNENLQSEVKNYVLQWIKEGLKDWDITRDIPWGVPVPSEEGKVFYGWFDNHLGYITFTLKHLQEKGIDGKQFWNSARIYHFIGKDIVYHHYLFLPAMRLAEGSFKLPDFIPTRGHLLLEGEKFSKSRKHYVSLRDFLEKFPPDYLRYYLATITTYSQADVNFNWKEFEAKINNELIDNIGNFIHRALNFVWNNFEGFVPKPNGHEESDKEMERKIKAVPPEVGKLIEENELSKALKAVADFSAFCNQYFQKKEPWKTNDTTSLYLAVNAVKTLAVLLEPFIPFSVAKIYEQLNIKPSKEWSSASKLEINPGHKIKKPEVLFKKIKI